MINSIPDREISKDISACVHDTSVSRFVRLDLEPDLLDKHGRVYLTEADARRLVLFLADALVDKGHERTER